MNYITYDIETYHPDRADEFSVSKFRVSVIGAYISWTDEYVAFLEEDVGTFLSLVQKADLLIGFNHIWFDNAVLAKYADYNLNTEVNNYDIMLEFEKKAGHKIKLDDLAAGTLGRNKTDHYSQFVNYYWDKEWSKLIDYCMHDVKITEELFRRILDGKPLIYKDLLGTKEQTLDLPVLVAKIKKEAAMEALM
jgi:RNase_H superfamily